MIGAHKIGRYVNRDDLFDIRLEDSANVLFSDDSDITIMDFSRVSLEVVC